MFKQLLLVALLGFSAVAGIGAGAGHGSGLAVVHGGGLAVGQGKGLAVAPGGVLGVGQGKGLAVAPGGVLGVGQGKGFAVANAGGLALGLVGGPGSYGNFAPARYSFGYDVNAPQYGNNFGHSESRDGALTKGEYKVQLPDGRLQTVTYHVDNWGYHPVVSYTGVARFPARVSPLHGGVFGGGVFGVGGVHGVGGAGGVYH